MVAALVFIAVACLSIALLYHGRAYLAWLLGASCALVAVSGLQLTAASGLAAGALLCTALVFGLPPLRRLLVTPVLMRWLSGMLPRLSDTERVALSAGTVWWDGELFSGAPNWQSLFEFEVQELSDREREFLAGPVEELCGMLDEWEIQQSGDLSPEIWSFLKQRGFFGLIIPREYAGLAFSAAAHSAVVTKLASRSVTAAVTVMVPNSLGPAELLVRYGTPEQKQQYLPRTGARARDPLLRTHGARGRQPRGGDAERGHRVPAFVRGARTARRVPPLAQALHHARSGGHADRPGVSSARSREAARR